MKSILGGKLSVDADSCKGCGYCVDNCPQNVYEFDANHKAKVARFDDCILCCNCLHNCSQNAILAGGKVYQQFKFQPWMISDKEGKQNVNELKADYQRALE